MNLKKSPLKANGEYHKIYLYICDALKRLPEDLYPREHLVMPLRTNKVTKEISFNEIVQYLVPPPGPLEALINTERKEAIQEALLTLSPRQGRILILRFGLFGNESHSLEGIGQMYGITRERVRQIEEKALERLKQRVQTKLLPKLKELSNAS